MDKVTFLAGETLAIHRAVKFSTSAANTVVYADDEEQPIGVTLNSADSGEPIAVDLWGGKMLTIESVATFTDGVPVYIANDGKADVSGTTVFGYTGTAASSGDFFDIFSL